MSPREGRIDNGAAYPDGETSDNKSGEDDDMPELWDFGHMHMEDDEDTDDESPGSPFWANTSQNDVFVGSCPAVVFTRHT